MSIATLSPSDPQILNELYGLDSYVQFEDGPGNSPIARLKNADQEATISIYGGHVLSYGYNNKPPVLWVSDLAVYREGKAIRGGIPVIWPWFGANRRDAEKPSHGFARTNTWEVKSSSVVENQFPQICLSFQTSEATYAMWPHSFRLELSITLAEGLVVDLKIINTGNSPFDFTGALHTYFNVSQISDIQILGLEKSLYHDQLDNMAIKTQQGSISFDGEFDNIYFDTKSTCRLTDPGFDREIIVEKRGSKSTVVWNPWIAKAQRMSDFGDEEYKTMVCIETANAGPDSITLNPGGHHILGTTIRTQS